MESTQQSVDYEMANNIPTLRIVHNYKPKYTNFGAPEPTKDYLVRCAKLSVLWFLASSVVIALEGAINDYNTDL
eukprot:CAMPEP_0116877144 /NCGR_PEP_ID=MMETSP0463-20121206/8958_1 /TAXON_ID=181622 /ORGANISM="Strombidinopsis sp, Strain SopsisLIS2011" /LENGTH=73 /DNA_ID=CAMNT_0004524199 /DNA_START=25 /DNA_END=246 /DNA_ORIENTATION=+